MPADQCAADALENHFISDNAPLGDTFPLARLQAQLRNKCAVANHLSTSLDS